MAGFRIPDNDVAAFPLQSQVYELDLAIATAQAGIVVSGCAVAAQGSPDLSVHVAAGRVRLAGTIQTVAADDLVVSAAHATLFRIDLVTADAAGVATITDGTPASLAAVKPPALPAGHAALAFVYVPPTATEVGADQIIDKRYMVDAGVPPTVVAHGAMGATETFDYGDGPAHEGTVDANLTVTLTGAVAGECIISLGLTIDGTGGWTLALPGSVSNAAEIEAAFDSAAGMYNLIVLRTVDSGTTWYGLRVAPGPPGASLSYPEGTSFPGSPSTDDKFYRTDLNLLFYYDGTRWLTTTLFGAHMGPNVVISTAGAGGPRFRASPMNAGLDLWLVALDLSIGVFGTNNGSNYWTWTLDKRAVDDAATTIATGNTSGFTASNWTPVTTAIGAALAVATYFNFLVNGSAKTGSPGNLQINGGFTYRLIGV